MAKDTKLQTPGEIGQKADEHTNLAALSYISPLLLSIIGPLAIYFISDKDDKYTRLHAATASVIEVVALVVFFIIAVPSALLYFLVPSISVYALGLAVCILVPLYGIYKLFLLFAGFRAFKGNPVTIPFFTKFCKRFE